MSEMFRHTCSTESLEDGSVDGLLVNTPVCHSQCCSTSAVVNRKTGGMFSRTTQKGESVFFQSRGWPLLSPPLRSCGAWSFAQLRGCAHDAHCLSFSSQFVSSNSVTVQWTSCATHMNQENCSCTVISIHFITLTTNIFLGTPSVSRAVRSARGLDDPMEWMRHELPLTSEDFDTVMSEPRSESGQRG